MFLEEIQTSLVRPQLSAFFYICLYWLFTVYHYHNVFRFRVVQVCEEQKCQEDIFPLAVNYLDRFLSVKPVNKNHLQLLGTTCLLVSSKLRESDSLNVDLLIVYTDNTVTTEDLLVSDRTLSIIVSSSCNFLFQNTHRDNTRSTCDLGVNDGVKYSAW